MVVVVLVGCDSDWCVGGDDDFGCDNISRGLYGVSFCGCMRESE